MNNNFKSVNSMLCSIFGFKTLNYKRELKLLEDNKFPIDNRIDTKITSLYFTIIIKIKIKYE